MREVEAHDPAQQVEGLRRPKPKTTQERINPPLCRVVPQGVEDVAVGVGIPEEQAPKQWDKMGQILEVEPSERRPLRLPEVEDEQPSPWTQDPMHFGQPLRDVGKVPEPIADGDDIEGPVLESKPEGIALLERHGLGDRIPQSPLARDVQHRFTEIDTQDFRPFCPKGQGDVAGAAAQVEGFLPWADRRKPEEATFPEAVETETLEVVDEIIARRHLGKEVSHPFRPPLIPHIEFARHAGGQ